MGFEPTPTLTAVPNNTETTVIPTRPLRSLKRKLSWPRFMLDSLHYPSDRVTRFCCANTIIYIHGIPGSYGYRSLETIYYMYTPRQKFDTFWFNSVKIKLAAKYFKNEIFKW